MRFHKHIHEVFEHYFTDTGLTSSGSLFEKSLWPFVIGCVLAFFSLGFGSVTVFETSIPVVFFMLGLAGFMLTVVVHFFLVIIGSFYKRGIFKTIGWGIFGVVGVIVGAIAVGFTLYGGIFISGILFLFVIPADTIFIPFNLIGFIGGAIWWYMKGLEILEGNLDPRNALDTEIAFVKRVFSIERAS